MKTPETKKQFDGVVDIKDRAKLDLNDIKNLFECFTKQNLEWEPWRIYCGL